VEDKTIVELYWRRSDEAIPATQQKYGDYCLAIAQNILTDRRDAEECVSDTWLQAWNSMPPHRPAVLSAFLGKITRGLCLNRFRHNHAQKRGGGQLPLVLEELAESLPGGTETEEELDRRQLEQLIGGFLAGLPPKKRAIFLCRYWYADSIDSIADRFGMSSGGVTLCLSRLRGGLRQTLEKGGYAL